MFEPIVFLKSSTCFVACWRILPQVGLEPWACKGRLLSWTSHSRPFPTEGWRFELKFTLPGVVPWTPSSLERSPKAKSQSYFFDTFWWNTSNESARISTLSGPNSPTAGPGLKLNVEKTQREPVALRGAKKPCFVFEIHHQSFPGLRWLHIAGSQSKDMCKW